MSLPKRPGPVSNTTVNEWFTCPGGDVTYNQRYFLALFSGCVPVIFGFTPAESLGGSYYGAAAHQQAANRRARQRKLIRHPELRNQVVERIKNGPLSAACCACACRSTGRLSRSATG